MPDIDTQGRIRRLPARAVATIAGAALLAVGGGVGAVAMHATRPSVTMAPATPVAITALQSGSIATIKGRVAEIFGNKFILQDAAGRALVETGRQGEGGTLVTAGETVTVQGRFEHGFVHAAFLIGPDAKVVALGPLGGPHDGGGGRHGPRHGPDDGPEATDRETPPPAPPAGGDVAAAPAAHR